MIVPFINVIMPAYNSERYIADALGSLLSQTGVEVEVIVVSDGSTDRTNDIVRTFADTEKRVRLIETSHQGVAAARNIGLAAVRADFVTFLDSDDLCVPGRLLRQSLHLLNDDALDAVVGDMMLFDVAGGDGMPAPEAQTEMLTGASLTTVLFRRRVLEKIGSCDETLSYAEDVDLLLRLWESGAAIKFEGEVAIYYRRHENNMTNDRDTMARNVLRAFHRSLTRRRQAGNLAPTPSIFARKLS